MAADHPSKPVMVADYASVENDGGSKAQWIADAFAAMPNYSNLWAAVWFDYNPGDESFPIDSSSASMAADRSAIANPIFSPDVPYP